MNIFQKYFNFFILCLVTYLVVDKVFTVEKMSNTDIENTIKKIYQIDVNAIRNLSKLANNLTINNKLIVPGGLEIQGPLTVSKSITTETLKVKSKTELDDEVTMKKGLKITGTLHKQGSNCLELVGGLSVKNGTVLINRSDNYQALDVVAKGGVRVTGNVNAEGDVNAKGNGYFGPAYIGKHGKTNSSYAQFSHSNRTGTSDYALIQHSNGTTYMNASKGQNLHFRVENKGDGNVIRKDTNYKIFQVNSHHGGLYLHGYNSKKVGVADSKRYPGWATTFQFRTSVFH